ncbi:VWA domain-containing protein [Georgenia sp. H159]|uniref:VWA domain-containing protein n=1 Tax=Georgenia sp. H159 TaxID=3076115 RepID=UPI002D76B988|nr:VWA domain-containing protein [Georgenia sp. H159]
MASAATERGRGTAVRVLGLVVIIAVIAVLAWAILRQYAAEPGAPAAPEDEGAGCGREVTVQVTTTSDFAPVVVAAGDRLRAADPCTTYAVTALPSSLMAEQIRSGTTLYHVWIPDSDVWVERVNRDPSAPTLTTGPVLATTPVVIGVPSTQAASTGLSGAVPWQEILGGPLHPRLADPAESTTGLLLLHSADAALRGTPQGERLLGAETIRMSRATASDDDLLAQASSDVEGVTAVGTTEQRVFRQRAQYPATPLEVVVPAEGAGALSYSWVPLPGPDQGVGMQDALAALEEALTGELGLAALQEEGFRGPDGGSAPDVPGMPADVVTTAPAPSAAAADALVTAWNTVAVDMRMLAVIDVSGSMLQPVGEQTRIGLAAASAGTAMQIFPPTSQVGLWVFSTDHRGGSDWTELAPIAPLNAEDGAGTHRDALLEAVTTLPGQPREGRDTGLYDTVLAAYLEVQENFEPGYVNSVVLLTDGVNEDDDGLSLSQLLAELQAAVDPSKPIPVITVGMGPGTDEEVLRLIAAQTGGRSYLARNPADISTVFVDALTHRARVE